MYCGLTALATLVNSTGRVQHDLHAVLWSGPGFWSFGREMVALPSTIASTHLVCHPPRSPVAHHKPPHHAPPPPLQVLAVGIT